MATLSLVSSTILHNYSKDFCDIKIFCNLFGNLLFFHSLLRCWYFHFVLGALLTIYTLRDFIYCHNIVVTLYIYANALHLNHRS